MAVAESDQTRPPALVGFEWALAHIDDPGVRFIEVDVDTGAYETGHIPGAVAWNWQTQLNDPVRRDLAGRAQLENLLQSAGVDDGTTIVLYGDNNNWFATWAYWQLRYHGLTNVRLLDGGRRKWEAEQGPLTTDAPDHPKGTITVPYETREELRAYRDEVAAGIGRRDWALVDVRSPEE